MKKRLLICMALICFILSTLSGCETFARAFADQAGRNVADSLFDK